ncbi:(d)CMP kinase [endosymbiont GvMRE of Glomus versiforme]|uniref:(d)CMP kinase n=1 Tax=endosymbiont GvMRE of Glomus versiforme TaxID=2039283 RepID=UPI000EE23549|nr:(d)CMP kinase [endosymbiont GvMRE of Glomus versiforme]RHZ37041.1 Cytidylate kinase [endosymbiont GvMRE of Glomus versiforme]
MPKINIAIDGPAGSGKTTLGKTLAQKINYHFIDSGLFYRYFAKVCWENGVNYQEKEKVISVCSQQKEKVATNPTNFLQELEKQKNTLSQPEIGNLASQFAPIKELRFIIYQLIRSLARSKGFVVSGRDITFKVLPEAEIKVFLTADLTIRAKRRHLQLQNEGKNLTLDEVKKDLKERDLRDQANILAAEKTADWKINTTNLNSDESLEKLYNLYKKMLNREESS